MRAVVQRVTNADVKIDGRVNGKIDNGLLVLLGVGNGDTEEDMKYIADKIIKLRIFSDENDKMNKSVLDIGGEVLVVSQFTLCADVKKGNRPSFDNSAKPDEAKALYEYFCSELLKNGVKNVETGVFGAHMQVSLVNNGPVTIIYDTSVWKK